METMKAAIYYNNHDIRIEERPIPDINDDEILVKTIACGLCSGEALEWYQVRSAPKVMGHEPAGIIAKVGKHVKNLKEGDRVFVNHHVACMTCHECIRGHYTLCQSYKQSHLDPGAMCEYFRVPTENLQKDTLIIPNNVSFEDATVCEPWGCVVGGLKVAGIKPGDTVAVVGCGFMGMGFLHMAPLFGAGNVIGLDFSDWRLEKARELGATHTINPNFHDPNSKLAELNNGMAADVVIVTVPNIAAWELGHKLTARGGSIHFCAPPPANQSWILDPEKLYFSEVMITSKYSADHFDTRTVMNWLASGRINARLAITNHFDLDGISEAFSLLLAADKSLKTVIYPNGKPS